MVTTVADILGLNRPRRIPPRWAEHYRRLCAERDRLAERDCPTSISAPVKIDDMTDAAADESSRSLELVTSNATHVTTGEVLEAIYRIEHGTYGVCEVTGEPIEPERLHAIPWTRYSLEGQREIEKSGYGGRMALPNLEPVNEAEASGEDSESEEEAS